MSWNTRDLLIRCLESLRSDVEAGRAEVWVVDNASTDGSAEEARERFEWVTVIDAGENLGFGRAVNRVARNGPRTPWLAIANADVALEAGALAAVMAAGDGDPGAGVLAPRLVLPGGRVQHSVQSFPTLPLTLAFNLGVTGLSRRLADRLCIEGAWDPERPRRVPWAIGAFLLVRREAWDAVGGFDERHWMYAEDVDLAWRLRRQGWATRYVPEARVLHESGASTAQAFDEAADRWQRATYAWMLHRRGPAVTRAVAAVNLAGAAARWLARAPLARLRPARWAAGRDTWRAWAGRHATGLRGRAELERYR